MGKQWVLEDVSLEVAAGEILALTGPNGGGKSVLLAACATLVAPSTGRIDVDGVAVSAGKPAVRRLIGYLPDEIGWHPRLSPREDLEFFAAAQSVPRTLRRPRVVEALERWGLLAVAENSTGSLSRGFRRRLGLARAWLHGPRVLLLDDPTVALDAEARALLWRELRRHVDAGGSALMASHDPVALARAHRVGVLVGGRLSHFAGRPAGDGVHGETSAFAGTDAL